MPKKHTKYTVEYTVDGQETCLVVMVPGTWTRLQVEVSVLFDLSFIGVFECEMTEIAP